jgi:hypothetical protein
MRMLTYFINRAGNSCNKFKMNRSRGSMSF